MKNDYPRFEVVLKLDSNGDTIIKVFDNLKKCFVEYILNNKKHDTWENTESALSFISQQNKENM